MTQPTFPATLGPAASQHSRPVTHSKKADTFATSPSVALPVLCQKVYIPRHPSPLLLFTSTTHKATIMSTIPGTNTTTADVQKDAQKLGNDVANKASQVANDASKTAQDAAQQAKEGGESLVQQATELASSK